MKKKLLKLVDYRTLYRSQCFILCNQLGSLEILLAKEKHNKCKNYTVDSDCSTFRPQSTILKL